MAKKRLGLRKCEGCRYFHNGELTGECRYNPPRIFYDYSDLRNSEWPD